MNLFVTDECPHQAARNLPDKLVCKMAIENCQLIATDLSEEYLNWGLLPKKDGTPYKPTHKNHPCTIWGRESTANIAWLVAHGLSICDEYEKRYKKVHASKEPHLRALFMLVLNGIRPSSFEDHTPFIRAMPVELKNDDTITTIEAYRRFMHTKHYAKWKHGNEPDWWNAEEHRRLKSLSSVE